MVDNPASFHASTARPPSARPFPRSSTRHEHPYLASKSPAPKKELGLIDLLFVKVFRCFVAEDYLPPPDPNAIVYQADKSSSTTVSLNTTITNTNSTALKESPLVKLPKYNKPPPEEPKKPKVEYRFASSSAATRVRSDASAFSEDVLPIFRSNTDDRNSTSKLETAQPQTSGRVSSLSAMFEKN